MSGPKTVEAARALPEHRTFDGVYPYLGRKGIDGNTIIAFRDVDGRAMTVDCRRAHPDGRDVWVKVPL